MSRSGYSDDCENYGLWRGAVEKATYGKRGQSFLKDLAKAMDEMPVKELIAHELISDKGEMCTIGVVCKSRGLNTKSVDIDDYESVGRLVNIAGALAAEIEFENDERRQNETPSERWVRMREWVSNNIAESP